MSSTVNASVAGIGSGGASQAFQSLGSLSGAIAADLSLGPNIAWTSTGAVTLTFSNTPSLNTALRVVLTITNGGAGAVTWPVGIRWAGAGIVGSAPTLTASGTDKVVIDITNNGGSLTYDGSYVGRVA